MDQQEIYDKLGEVFSDVFMRDDITLRPELTAKDVPGWDSFKQIEIVMSAEEMFDIKLHTRELDNLTNVGDLVRTIETKLV